MLTATPCGCLPAGANHKFCRELATCSNLDQLVACHRRMMEDITSKALFGYRDVRPAIDKIIGTILRFQGVVNSFDTLVRLAAERMLCRTA